MALLNPSSFGFPACSITYVHFGTISPTPFDPLDTSLYQNYTDESSYIATLSPLCLAAFRGLTEVARFLLQFDYPDKESDSSLALFLANRSGHLETSALLLDKKANPLKPLSANGLHGAAWRGLHDHIRTYTRGDIDPDITDASSATPVIYAILGIQDEIGAWETINLLFNQGAKPWRKLEEWEIPLSPTILNTSRDLSCMPGEGDDTKPNNEQPHKVPEARGALNTIDEASHTGEEDNDVSPNNEGPREDSGTGRGSGSNRNPSGCKRPREDSETASETKRARTAQ
ncbi:unnamed protein product [Fusarium fujikuroi]|uniref:Ankyrin n=1 Tax=Fusarium fujikuroi TaxID=5127 RepID=A0A9Q9UGK2_FUSFU|nr:unnamed protein product [Fusarium fujikuroi]